MKQTAVEWLFQELDNYYEMKGNVIKKEILKQAKEMQRQQIVDAFINEMNGIEEITSEQYYNETFKNQLQG